MIPRFESNCCSRRGSVKIIIIVVVCAVVLLGVFLTRGIMTAYAEYTSEQEQRALLADFARPFAELNEGVAVALDPQLHGRLVVFDLETDDIAYFQHDQLPDDMLATGPDDVGCIALVTDIRMEVGTYVDEDTGQESGTAYQTLTSVRIIDVSTREVIAQDLIEGDMPSRVIQFDGDNSGRRPFWKLKDYLQKLPRR